MAGLVPHIVFTQVKLVVHMHVGSGQTMELSTGGLFLLRLEKGAYQQGG